MTFDIPASQDGPDLANRPEGDLQSSPVRALTVAETIKALHDALRDYIEATYHISHPALVQDRAELLNTNGVISQEPFFESTPRYVKSEPFKEIAGLNPAVLEVFDAVSQAATGTNGDGRKLIFDPPYKHQLDAVRDAVVAGKDLVVMTGTGSGKTESFLLPILARLAIEAADQPKVFAEQSAVRALVLYPMNALVNDQLGRIRLLFADSRIVAFFKKKAGRPARFARYTSRTLYPGVRQEKRDKLRLKPIGDYYVSKLNQGQAAAGLVSELRRRGKWPAKPNLPAWYGVAGTHWRDKNGEFQRCVTMPDDAELLTRHEVHANPPDVVVTNYSMLEYMLLRPLERPVFEKTRRWLADNPKSKFLLVLDEAHLYRGAGGTEVALLIRRLRARLGITPDRLQVICTSASFSDPENARRFGAQLTGKPAEGFQIIRGDLDLRSPDAAATPAEAELLAKVDLGGFQTADTPEKRIKVLKPFLFGRGISQERLGSETLESLLFASLSTFAPLNRLINMSMETAWPLRTLEGTVFPNMDAQTAARATTALMTLASVARPSPDEPGLLPCRVHAFFRGLPGLWVCMDPKCPKVSKQVEGPDAEALGRPAGRLYEQPRERCECGARVLELYTCRHCGTSYARGYTDNLEQPTYLWAEPGEAFADEGGGTVELHSLDLLLEPNRQDAERADYDLITGRLNGREGPRMRTVYLRVDRAITVEQDEDDLAYSTDDASLGEFKPCGVCGQVAGYGRSSVQDHQTKGDQPFQALVSRQLEVQAPNAKIATTFAPHRGRKVLVFSDSRQMAARLAPNLQTYSMQDVLRPLIVAGFSKLEAAPGLSSLLSLDDVYLATLVAAKQLGVQLRPELRRDESFDIERKVARAIDAGSLADPVKSTSLLVDVSRATIPESLLRGVYKVLTDRFVGLEALALGSVKERGSQRDEIVDFPNIAGVAETPEAKLSLTRLWISQWLRYGIALKGMPPQWQNDELRLHTGRFQILDRVLPDKGSRTLFTKEWLPRLRSLFAQRMGGTEKAPKFRLKGAEVTLWLGGEWQICRVCRGVQRPFPGVSSCLRCGAADPGDVRELDPDNDPVFTARKGYYRQTAIKAIGGVPPLALIAAEHTAQIGTAQAHEIYSRAEEHELLFQDVELDPDDRGRKQAAIDVLSCTTTMEVGIDIGALSGVALRNMPPARSNYQQRAGRAGRRGTSIATVIALASADSHDEHYFSAPHELIRGRVNDPRLILDNYDIARRHVTAYVLQRYHEDRLPNIDPEQQPQLFEVLGTVSAFRNVSSVLNREDLERWLSDNVEQLKVEVQGWLPTELNKVSLTRMLDGLIPETMASIDLALEGDAGVDEEDVTSQYPDWTAADRQTPSRVNKRRGQSAANGPPKQGEAPDGPSVSEEVLVGSNSNANSDPSVVENEVGTGDFVEVPSEVGEDHSPHDELQRNLLDRLLYKGVLPRYAFPTDVATFHVFDPANSRGPFPAFRFTPSQSLPIALSTYAPGKDVWIANKRYRSGAIYSPIKGERARAWTEKALYYECRNCHFANKRALSEGQRGERINCPACGTPDAFGEARYWIRPPGFAHPISWDEEVSPDDQPARSYATRAKLDAPTPPPDAEWSIVTERLRAHYLREMLLVTNTGPRSEGYTYCTLCGRVEPTAVSLGELAGPHKKPFPDDRHPDCGGGRAAKGICLGVDFISDILLLSLRVESPVRLTPGYFASEIALRTVSEAIAKATCEVLQLEAGEVQADFRAALTEEGQSGLEAEVYVYDTLAGGAGFARQAGERIGDVLRAALKTLLACDCDTSCYKCLRSFKNKFEHDRLDRHIGADLLRYALDDVRPELPAARTEAALLQIAEDLTRQAGGDLVIQRNATLSSDVGDVIAPILITNPSGIRRVVCVTHPLTALTPSDEALANLQEYTTIVVDPIHELRVRRSLPWVTRGVLSAMGLTHDH